MLLLGCEPRDDRGNRHFWSDFTGGLDDADTSAHETAAREFSEETRGAYSIAEAQKRIEGAVAREMVDGKVLIFLTEVRWIDSTEIQQRPATDESEKHRYCWVEAADLLARIDAAGLGPARVPDHCGAEPRALYDLFQRNLVAGTPLRSDLDELPLR
jgi:8-oxo-dGTP pyrophosphatase MutT (NUDIX family)